MKQRFYTIWDKKKIDYGFTMFGEFPVFAKRKLAEEIRKQWNEDDTMLMYQKDEAIEAGSLKDSKRYKVVEVLVHVIDKKPKK